MLPYHRKLLSAVGGGLYEVEGVTLDGTNDYLSRGQLSGVSDGNLGTFSFWARRSASVSGFQERIFSISGTQAVDLLLDNSNRFSIRVGNASDQQIFILNTSAISTINNGDWHHVYVAYNTSTSFCKWFVDGVFKGGGSITILNSGPVDYTNSDVVVGAFDNAFIDKWSGDFAEFYANFSEYLDPEVAGNIEKFYSADGKPVDLGTDGSIPTGNQPIIYLSNRPGDSASDFATNRGSGGNFTVTGALATASTSPSD